MDGFKLFDLFPYLTWDCPLNDSNYAATLVRVIVSYLGKQEIVLTMVGYQNECRDIDAIQILSRYSYIPIAGPSVNENAMFRYKTCCISTNGSFYLIEDKFIKTHDRVVLTVHVNWTQYHRVWSDWKYIYDGKNLKYVNHKDINSFKSAKPVEDDKDGTVSIQKYLKTMENKQQAQIEAVPVEVTDKKKESEHKNSRKYVNTAAVKRPKKQIKIERICVIDFDEIGDEKEQDTVSDDDTDDVKEENEEKTDFHWGKPIQQKNNTAMVFLLNNHKINVFINGNDPFSVKIEENHKVLDIWQCNKQIYLITQSISHYDIRIHLIQLQFVKNPKKQQKQQQQRRMEKGTMVKKSLYQVKQKLQLNLKVEHFGAKLGTPKSKHSTDTSSGNGGSFSFGSDVLFVPNICQNCNYYDAKSQTLLTVENMKIEINNSSKGTKKKSKSTDKKTNKKTNKNINKKMFKHGGIVIRLIAKEKRQIEYDYLGNKSNTAIKKDGKKKKAIVSDKQNKSKNKDKKNDKTVLNEKNKSEIEPKQSETEQVKSSKHLVSPQKSKNDRSKSPKANRKLPRLKPTYSAPVKTAEVTVIDEIKFQSLFLNLLFQESKCHFVFYHKLSKTFVLMLKIVANINIININNVNVEEKRDENLEAVTSKNMSNYNYDEANLSGINSTSRFLEWKENLIKYNNGRLLVQLKIDFSKKKLISSKIGNIIINENKCRIIAYDSTRSMIIYDTLPDVKRQYKVLIHKDEFKDKWTYDRVQLWSLDKAEARIHNYKMMRLNDLIDRWIDLHVV